MSDTTAGRPVVVVGIDGSAASKHVLRWAIRQARALRGRLHVVLAWQFPEVPGYRPYRTESDLSEATEKLVDRLVTETLEEIDIRAGELEVETTVQEGGAVRILLENAQHASLLVIGAHGDGHDGVKALGSVVHSCLAQAPCPITVVPTNAR